MAQTSSLKCLPCRNPYQTPSSLNCLPPFNWKTLFFTEKCFVACPSQRSSLKTDHARNLAPHVLPIKLPDRRLKIPYRRIRGEGQGVASGNQSFIGVPLVSRGHLAAWCPFAGMERPPLPFQQAGLLCWLQAADLQPAQQREDRHLRRRCLSCPRLKRDNTILFLPLLFGPPTPAQKDNVT